MIEKTAAKDDEDKRFDAVARAAFPHLQLSEIFKSIRIGRLKLNGKKAKGNVRICAGDVLQYHGHYQEVKPQKEAICHAEFSHAQIPVIWENEDLLALNKPRSWKVHDGPDSLQAWVCQREGQNASLSFRAGPCHRLDRNTTGVLVFAKSAHGARQFAQKQKENKLYKVYIGLLNAQLLQETVWISALTYQDGQAFADEEGRQAVTYVKPLAHHAGKTMALFRLGSGRTHQIRAQAAHAGCPLAGDGKYGGGKGSYHLHALLLKDQSEDSLFPALWADLTGEMKKILSQFHLNIQDIQENSLHMKNYADDSI